MSATHLPAEKKEKLTPEERKMLSRRDLTIQEKELLLSRELTDKEREILTAPPTSVRRPVVKRPGKDFNSDLTADPKTLPPTFDFVFRNRLGIGVCIPGFDEFSAQKLLNQFLEHPEIVAVESDDAPVSTDADETPVAATKSEFGKEPAKKNT